MKLWRGFNLFMTTFPMAQLGRPLAHFFAALPLLAWLASPAQAQTQVGVSVDFVCPSVPGFSPTPLAGVVIKIGDQQFTSVLEGNSVPMPPGDYTVTASFPGYPNLKLGYVLQGKPGLVFGTIRINPGSDGNVRVTLQMAKENLYVYTFFCPGGATPPNQPAGPATDNSAVCADYLARIQRLQMEVSVIYGNENPLGEIGKARDRLQDASRTIAGIKNGTLTGNIDEEQEYRRTQYVRIAELQAIMRKIEALIPEYRRLKSEAKAAGCAVGGEADAPKTGVDKAIEEVLDLDSPKNPSTNPSAEIMGVAGVQGNVEIQSADGTVGRLTSGTGIGLGRSPITIRTGPGSSVTIQVGSVRKTLQPNTTIRIVPSGNGGPPDFIEQGGATVDVRKPGPYQIQTPNATAKVDGTVFTVSYDATTGVTGVMLEEGHVAVLPKNPRLGRGVTLTPGEYVEVGRDAMGPVLPAPGAEQSGGGGISPGPNRPGSLPNNPQPAPTGAPQGIDLTGLWVDDTGGGAVYHVRQVGNRVYWIVDGTSVGSFANLSYGEISGNTITGIWVDMPGSPSLGGGNLTLRIESNDRLVKVASNGSYGAQSWTRKGSTSTTTSVNPQSFDLTGLWVDDTGGGAIYHVRQVGSRVYWIVDGTSVGSFANLSYGEISGNTITGIWVDMPGSPSLGGGNLTLRIESNDRLVKVGSNGSYGAQSWTRKGSASVAPVKAERIDLTGLWVDDTGGGAVYHMRQLGNRVYWIVDGTSVGSFANLSYGEISGNTITGIWVDMPGSPSLGGGNLTLRIESNNRLVKVGSSSYGAQTWTRK
jgi:hypothetical protein